MHFTIWQNKVSLSNKNNGMILIDVILDSRHFIILSRSPFVYVDVPLPNVKDES